MFFNHKIIKLELKKSGNLRKLNNPLQIACVLRKKIKEKLENILYDYENASCKTFEVHTNQFLENLYT